MKSLAGLKPSSRAHRGQALPAAVLLIAAAAMALLAMYNVGQVAATRVHLANAADAASYSGALISARALNMLAYMNRAQVAHQVAMAHLVTMAAWAQFGATEAKQAARFNPPPHVIAMMFGISQANAYVQSARAVAAKGAEQQLASAAAWHDKTVHDVLARVSADVVKTLGPARDAAVRAVLSANFPDQKIGSLAGRGMKAAPDLDGHAAIIPVILSDNLDGFLLRIAAHGNTPLRSLVLDAASRYHYLDSRDAIVRNSWPVSYRCPLERHELRRQGTHGWMRKGIGWRTTRCLFTRFVPIST